MQERPWIWVRWVGLWIPKRLICSDVLDANNLFAYVHGYQAIYSCCFGLLQGPNIDMSVTLALAELNWMALDSSSRFLYRRIHFVIFAAIHWFTHSAPLHYYPQHFPPQYNFREEAPCYLSPLLLSPFDELPIHQRPHQQQHIVLGGSPLEGMQDTCSFQQTSQLHGTNTNILI